MSAKLNRIIYAEKASSNQIDAFEIVEKTIAKKLERITSNTKLARHFLIFEKILLILLILYHGKIIVFKFYRSLGNGKSLAKSATSFLTFASSLGLSRFSIANLIH